MLTCYCSICVKGAGVGGWVYIYDTNTILTIHSGFIFKYISAIHAMVHVVMLMKTEKEFCFVFVLFLN